MTNHFTSPAALTTRNGPLPLALRVAATFMQRFSGLMLGAPLVPGTGLLIARCPSVHTMFMRYAIDVIYLDANGYVLKCVPRLKPWRASASNMNWRHSRAAHTLELAAGSIEQFGIARGDRLDHPLLHPASEPLAGIKLRQGGVAIIEMAVVGPILTVLGMTIIQYGMLFFAKNQINHAGFMAAREGSVKNANLDSIASAYDKALVPMYGGGETMSELATSLAAAKEDRIKYAQVELLNPTKEAFADHFDATLQTELKTGSRRVISNRNLAFRSRAVGPTSGQSVQDANLIKLRITHGYKPVVPIVGSIYTAYLKYFDTKTSAFHTMLIENDRIPVVTHVTMQMQSHAIEPDNPVSSPGAGNGGNPTDPGDPPSGPANPGPPPDCVLGGCSTNSPSTGGTCQAPYQTDLSADTLFAFDSSTLQAGGMVELDKLIAKVEELKLQVDTLRVTGHTDPLGTEAHNLALSKARAQAVLDYLNGKGLKASNVEVEGLGASALVKPLSECQNMSSAEQKACLAPNRRVVVEVLPK